MCDFDIWLRFSINSKMDSVFSNGPQKTEIWNIFQEIYGGLHLLVNVFHELKKGLHFFPRASEKFKFARKAAISQQYKQTNRTKIINQPVGGKWARRFSKGADTSPQLKVTNKQFKLELNNSKVNKKNQSRIK